VDNDTDGPNGLPSVTSTLTIQGADAATTFIARESGAPPFRLIHIAEDGILTLEGLTLQGGTVVTAPASSNCGGGIFNKGTLTLVQSTLAHNTPPSDGGNGTGLCNDGGMVYLLSSTVADNQGSHFSNLGGGIYTRGGVVSMLNSTLTRNTANKKYGSGGGGGLYNDGGTVRITNSTLARNAALNQSGPGGCGGGLSNTGGMVILTNSTVADNIGNGIDNGSGSVIIINSTVAGNSARFCPGGGIGNSSGGTVTLRNTILALNTASDSGPNCVGPITSLGTNLLGDLTDCTLTLLPTDLTGDPGLGPFTDDGTPGHGHFPLLPDSPAIDAGNNTACPTTDQLGQPRVGRCDIGAFEFNALPPVVNSLVTFVPLTSTYQTTSETTGCPGGFGGTFRFTARLTAKASSPALTDLRVQVQTLTNGNLLQNAIGGPGGVGATLMVPQADALADGLLSPEEAVDVPFVVCLQQFSPFRFLVDVLGIVSDEGQEQRADSVR
jgi:hypothetical protein